ncbi:putative phage holin [Streptomyces sp. NPDC004227]
MTLTWSMIVNAGASGLIVLVAGVFLVTYARIRPWRTTAMGWYLICFVATILGLGAYTVTITLVGVHSPAAPFLRVARVILLLVISGLLVLATRTVRRAQRPIAPPPPPEDAE